MSNNLILCPACKRDVSPTAKACIHCGDDLEQRRKNKKKTTELILLAVGVVLFFISVKTGLFNELIELGVNSVKNHFANR